MTTIDYDQLRGEVGGDPPDGMHSAYLARAALLSTRNGDKLITEWQTSDPPYYWNTWFGFDGQQMKFTQDFLDSIGVDRASITDDESLEDALGQCVGEVYSVRTEAGAAWVNTYVEEATPTAQTSLDDVPLATEGLPTAAPATAAAEPVAVAAATSDDDADRDIPF